MVFNRTRRHIAGECESCLRMARVYEYTMFEVCPRVMAALLLDHLRTASVTLCLSHCLLSLIDVPRLLPWDLAV